MYQPVEPDKFEEAMEEIARLRRAVKRMGRDNRALAKLYENADHLRRVFENERNLQYLYNDLLLKNSPNTVFLFDKGLHYVAGSRNTDNLSNLNQDSRLNKPFKQIFSPEVSEEWVDKTHALCLEALATRASYHYNDAVSVNINKSIHVKITIMPIVDEEAQTRGVVLSVTDVSELVESRLRSEAAVRAKNIFLANMSHEIRTPMNAVLGITEILLHEEHSADKRRQYIKDIKIATESLLGIINDILDISKLESGAMTIVPVNFNFKLMLDHLRSMAAYLAADKQLKFNFKAMGDLPTWLWGDDVRLRQLLLNLVSNAIKFTENGGSVTLAVSADGEHLFFEVSDTGIGIRDEDKAQLFEPFRQMDSLKNRQLEGTGLGLSICKRIVSLMQGHIEMESVYGQGSTFRISLPLVPGSEQLYGAQSNAGIRYSAEARVLVVDDNEINLNVAAGILSSIYGLNCDLALSGSEALEKAALTDYHIIFMDHMMPGMDGLEASRLIRLLSRHYENVPIIACTANAVRGAKEMMLEAGLNDYLSKPIKLNEVEAILFKWLPEKFRLMADHLKDQGKAEADAREEGFKDIPPYLASLEKFGELDIQAGLRTVVGNLAAYETSLKLLGEKIPGTVVALEQYLTAGDLSALAIEIHSLKSSLAIVGATVMSEHALNLEKAALAKDVVACRDRLPAFNMKLASLGRKLSQTVLDNGSPVDRKKPAGTAEDFSRQTHNLQQALSSFDFDEINTAFEQISSFDFGEKINREIEALGKQIGLFNYETALESLHNLVKEEF